LASESDLNFFIQKKLSKRVSDEEKQTLIEKIKAKSNKKKQNRKIKEKKKFI